MARGAGAWGTVNPTYRRYATVLHFHIDACPPRQPQAKGKVERRVREQRFALDPSRRAWTDLAELQRWTDGAARRVGPRAHLPGHGDERCRSLGQRETAPDAPARDPA